MPPADMPPNAPPGRSTTMSRRSRRPRAIPTSGMLRQWRTWAAFTVSGGPNCVEACCSARQGCKRLAGVYKQVTSCHSGCPEHAASTRITRTLQGTVSGLWRVPCLQAPQ